MFDAEAASFVCDFIECLTCSNGAPFRLMDWQRDAVTEFYGQLVEADGDEADPAGSYLRRYQYLYLEIAKKNGKSELAAALGVYHLYADGEVNGEVYVVAADRDNAGIVYSAAKWMVEHSPALMKRSRIVDSTKTIYDTVSGSKLKVLSSEAYSKHGYKPSCVIFDELHAQPNRERRFRKAGKRRLRGGACGSHCKGCALAKRRKAPARRAHKRGETNGFSPLANHPTSFRARCARKSEVPVSGCHPVRRIRTTFPTRAPEPVLAPAPDRMHQPIRG